MDRLPLFSAVAVLVAALSASPLALAQTEALRQRPELHAGDADRVSNAVPRDEGQTPFTSLLDSLNINAFLENNSLTQWGLLLGGILAGVVVGRIASMVLLHLGKRMHRRGWRSRARLLTGLAGPVGLSLLGLGLGLGLANLRMGPELRTFSAKTLLLIQSLAVFWYLFNLVGALDVLIRRVIGHSESTLDEQLTPLIRKSLRVFVVIFGAMFVIQSVFDQNIGTWLAGLGIAGLAVSLAAQDSLKNIFGSITILLDRPFHIGERIVFAGYDGMIEEIGFRSTKIRTLTGHQVNIPNSKIVSESVENIGRRPTIRRLMNVTITYDTPRAKIEQAVAILRAILEEEDIREPIRPTVNGDEFPPRVFFSDFNADSLNILVIYWYAPPAYWDFMEHAQRLNLRIFEEFEKAGIEFAFPTQTLYLAGDPKRQLALNMLSRDLPPCPS
ncbi:MAG: mechanosensitive ion channel family protein [Thermoguttaceae bacterium]|jgi:MscS family membrane protein|nr:mechanosensitive ion channel family protein [Thermoguttaceae bacterium]